MIAAHRLIVHVAPSGNLAAPPVGFHGWRNGMIAVAWQGDAAPPAAGDLVIQDAFAAEAAHSRPVIYNRLTVKDGALAIASDPFGLKPLYIARDGEDIFLASRLLDLIRLRPSLARPLDRHAYLALLVFGHLFDDQTLHARIRRLPADSASTWSRHDGFVTRSSGCLTDSLPDLTGVLTDTILHDIDDILTDGMSALPLAADGSALMALSGGFDSRILATKAHALKVPLTAFTYGHWRDRDALFARWIARRLGLEHHLLPYPDDVLRRHRDIFLRESEGQDDPALLQITNLLSLPQDAGSVLLHGYGGGTLFGDNVSDWMAEAQDTAGAQTAFAAAMIKKGGMKPEKIPPLAAALDLPADAMTAAVLAAVAAEPYDYVHQSLMAWDLKNRQRRFIGLHFALLGGRFRVRAPFYDARLIKLCMALPVGLLQDRLLDRLYLKKFFPRLGQIPHDQEVFPVVPSLKDQFTVALIDKLLRPTNIWRRTFGRQDAEAQRLMAQSADRSIAILRDVWGENIDLPAEALADQHIRKRLWSFADYSQVLGEITAG